jgi:hypothetical protein
MPGPYIANLLRHVVRYTDSQFGDAYNTFHTINAGALSISAANAAFITEFSTFWGTGAVTANQVRQYVYQGVDPITVRTTDMSVAGGAFVETPLVLNPGNEAQRYPPDLAIVISWQTGFSGGSKRGRTYIPGLAPSAADPSTGRIATACVNGLQVAATGLRVQLLAATIPLVVYSRIGAGAATTITGSAVNNHWDVQRRRGD